MGLLDELVRNGAGGVRYVEVVRLMGERSSVGLEANEVAEALRVLESEGKVQVAGEGPRRTVRRIMGVM